MLTQLHSSRRFFDIHKCLAMQSIGGTERQHCELWFRLTQFPFVLIPYTCSVIFASQFGPAWLMIQHIMDHNAFLSFSSMNPNTWHLRIWSMYHLLELTFAILILEISEVLPGRAMQTCSPWWRRYQLSETGQNISLIIPDHYILFNMCNSWKPLKSK